MTPDTMPQNDGPVVEPADRAVDHLRGSPGGRLIVEYGDYECPYSRQAFRATGRVERELDGAIRFALGHFPPTRIHPHALGAAAAARQGGFWDMRALLFHRRAWSTCSDTAWTSGRPCLQAARRVAAHGVGAHAGPAQRARRPGPGTAQPGVAAWSAGVAP